MHHFLDCEFNEFGGQLISMGLVDYTGKRELYFELPPPDPWGEWVAKNVRPLLTGPVITKEKAQEALREYFSGVEYPSIIVDHPADIVHFCQMIDLNFGNYIGRGWQFTVETGLRSFPEIPHHALNDARAFRLAYIAAQR